MVLFLVIFVLVLGLFAYWRLVLAVVLAVLIALVIVGVTTVGAAAMTPSGAVGNPPAGSAPR